MRLDATELRELAEIARAAAQAASQLIATSRPMHFERKSEASRASQIVTDIDCLAEQRILDALSSSSQTYDFGVLSEERGDDGSRLRKPYFWCVDPLDGTLPFAEGRPGYAVSIALVASDGTPLLGVVADPQADTVYSAIRGQGALRNGVPWSLDHGSSGTSLAVFVDRSMESGTDFPRIRIALDEISTSLGLRGVQIFVGAGAVMNACGVLERAPACYFKFPKVASGGGCAWDFAATACLLQEAGAIATDMRGAPLDLNRRDSTYMNHRGVLFASSAELASRIRELQFKSLGH